MSDVPSYTLAGWREWVSLPGLGVPWIKAKLDTGARTSAIHAFDLTEHTSDGEPRVRFGVHPWQESDADAVEVDLPVIDMREVRSSSGHAEERFVVPMEVTLIGRTVTVEMTLSRRDEMGFRMLVGREGLRQGYVVDPASSYLGGKPPLAQRRANRGR
ncbi:ATP-dependent zinc protease family protein [Nocardioides acrostichi]|uniref:ATP-dependent zinc protease n=1 Tax=Nocardioides acrostichi TaxID=2784339 RepID=A0A930UWP2_9ACTN|nr:RimK/LysX family protein [Nocardioides acrostichi]MBF4161052.1 ATP-dependent zinc protease [Nocardioides acrostichi]